MTKTLKKGFTLVELIVVIAIIAILSTVSVVGYSAFIKNANQSKVNQELAQVENILMAEAIEGIVIKDGEGIEKISMTLEGTTLVFKLGTEYEAEDFQELLSEAGVDVSMSKYMTLVRVGTDEVPGEPHILYQIDNEYSSYIIVEVE